MTNKPFKLTKRMARAVLATVDAGLVGGHDPGCVDLAVRALKIRLNDSVWSSDRARSVGMRRLAVLQLGTAGTIDGREFGRRVAEMTIRVIVPMALRASIPMLKKRDQKAMEAAAAKCETEGTDAAASAAVRAAVRAAYAAASAAASAAANAAAYAASAAVSAAVSAADAAAHTNASVAADAAAYAATNAAVAAAYAASAAAYAASAAAYAASAADAASAAAYAAANAASAAAIDSILSQFAGAVETILIGMDVPAVKYFALTE